MYPVTLRLIQKCFIPTYKWSMEISTYLVSINNFETISEILYRKGQKASIEISMYPGTLRLTLLKKLLLPKGSTEISMYPVTLRLILFKNVLQKGPWKFPCIL